MYISFEIFKWPEFIKMTQNLQVPFREKKNLIGVVSYVASFRCILLLESSVWGIDYIEYLLSYLPFRESTVDLEHGFELHECIYTWIFSINIYYSTT